MGRRWIEKEELLLAEIRRRLKDEIADRPQFPEVVGDRRLLRFLRGQQHRIEETIKMYSNFLKWRKANKVDEIRQDIVYGGKDTPFKFPGGAKIIKIAPQIIISALACDHKQQILALEQYCFSPREIMQNVTNEEYLVFLTYALEYRTLVMEQVSHERELAYCAKFPNMEDRAEGYGVLVMDYTIRDLKGIGLAHLGSEGRTLVKAALDLGIPNYPECLGKCHMVNVPWVFNAMWHFVKGLLDEASVAKVSLSSSNYMDTLLKDIPHESIPVALGGGFTSYNEAYVFDVSESGPLYYLGAPTSIKAPTAVSTYTEAVYYEKLEKNEISSENTSTTSSENNY